VNTNAIIVEGPRVTESRDALGQSHVIHQADYLYRINPCCGHRPAVGGTVPSVQESGHAARLCRLYHAGRPGWQSPFLWTLTGPTSTGLGWLLDVVNVSVTPYTYSEEFAGESSVLAADSLKIAFRVHVVWRVVPERVPEFIERYSTLQPGDPPDRIVEVAYANFIREPLRTYAREEVQKYKGLDIKDNITSIGEAVTNRVRALTGNTPFEIRSVVVGNIQYPADVADAVSRKLAAVQELERKATEIQITARKKEKRFIEAEGRATEIFSQRLTSAYPRYKAIKAQQEVIQSNNHTTVYIPVGPMGVPIVGNLDIGHASAPTVEPAR
jgi:regulator of protease activity HflC (stomatin/prohibitin superfamily)